MIPNVATRFRSFSCGAIKSLQFTIVKFIEIVSCLHNNCLKFKGRNFSMLICDTEKSFMLSTPSMKQPNWKETFQYHCDNH